MAQTTKIPEHECAKLECPFCNREMTPEQYEKARKANELKMNQQMAEERKRLDEEVRMKIEKADMQREKRSQEERKQDQKEKEEFEKMQRESWDRIKEQKDKIHAEQLASIVETKDKEMTQMRDSQATVAQDAYNQGITKKQSENDEMGQRLRENEIMMNAMRDELELTRKKLEQKQPYITGKAGEFKLKEKLEAQFPDDEFIEEKPGREEGDLLQIIKVDGEAIETPICYDNKVAKSVRKSEREKAKKYMRIHNTNHVMIVTRVIPKELENGLVGRIDGILHVHPNVVVDVAKEIRALIIENFRNSTSQKDRDSKESELYDYIASQEYIRQLEKILEVYEKMDALQISEERNHQTLWKCRKELTRQLSSVHVEITSGVNRITQDIAVAKPTKGKKPKKTK